MTTGLDELPTPLRGAALTSTLAWLPLLVVLAMPAIAGSDFPGAMRLVSRAAAVLGVLFLGALIGALLFWHRPDGHQRSVAQLTAAASLFGAIASGALFVFAVAVAPGVIR